MSLLLKKYGYSNIRMFDLSEPHIYIAQMLGIDATCCNFYNYDEKSKFDVIIANEITQFIQMDDIIEKAKKYLTDNGIIIINYINPRSFRQIYKIRKRPEAKKFQYITPNNFLSLWSERGFNQLKSRSYMWQINTSHSNSNFVYLFSAFEKIFFLSYNISWGPWIISVLQKKNDNNL